MSRNPELARYKALARGQPPAAVLPVLLRGRLVGRLVPAVHPLGQADLARLAGWRNLHRHAFFSQDEVTPESTARWLASIGGSGERILFLVYAAEELAGHVGLAEVDEAAAHAQSDAWLGAAPPLIPGLMLLAFAAMLRWAFTQLHLRTVGAEVFADNAAVLRAHRQLGYREHGVFELGDRRVLRLLLDADAFARAARPLA